MLPGYNIAKKGFDILRGNKRHERSGRVDEYGRRLIGFKALVGCMALGLGVGAVAGFGHEETVTTENVQSGNATVIEIDHTFHAEQVIGFKTKVDGAYADKDEKRTGPLGIPLPDIKTTEQFDNLVIDSSLCFPGGTKKISYDERNKKYEVKINADDISVCSSPDAMVVPTITPGGSFVVGVNDASTSFGLAIKSAFGIDINDPQVVAAQNQLRAELQQTARNAAIQVVNQKCGPQVFDATQQDIKKLIADDIPLKPGEAVDVTFDVGTSGGVKISGKSDIDAYFADKEKAGDRTHTVKTVGTCTLPADVSGAK